MIFFKFLIINYLNFWYGVCPRQQFSSKKKTENPISTRTEKQKKTQNKTLPMVTRGARHNIRVFAFVLERTKQNMREAYVARMTVVVVVWWSWWSG